MFNGMNFEDLQSFMQQQMGGQTLQEDVPPEKLDEFIKRCCKRDETLVSLAQSLQWALEQAPMISVPEAQVYPMVLQRIQYWMQEGKTILE